MPDNLHCQQDPLHRRTNGQSNQTARRKQNKSKDRQSINYPRVFLFLLLASIFWLQVSRANNGSHGQHHPPCFTRPIGFGQSDVVCLCLQLVLPRRRPIEPRSSSISRLCALRVHPLHCLPRIFRATKAHDHGPPADVDGRRGPQRDPLLWRLHCLCADAERLVDRVRGGAELHAQPGRGRNCGRRV
ncbi:hypothetical protein BB8028_0006g01900 [Beauveria bassiana]|uniref:Uncharacterized protein n=1 Tax=Beauveria bassiana TaxID=176275 RepID=A0A2S7YI60_BEABA|nr:hypothetical protein BB8028_0006g01900 [Beauveria bassiana]